MSTSGYLLTPLVLPLPSGWTEDAKPLLLPNGIEARVFYYRDGLRVLGSLEQHQDGNQWAHVSCSYVNRLPSWNDLKAVKEIFLGDVMAFQVLPPKAEYVNRHEYTLHLWCCLNQELPPRPVRRAP